MVRKLTRVESEAICATSALPVRWVPVPAYLPRSIEKLDLVEQVIVRRLAKGQSGRAIAKALHRGDNVVNHIIKGMLKRHGVNSREELLALPIVQAALGSDDNV